MWNGFKASDGIGNFDAYKILILVILAILIMARFFYLDINSFWFDELWTLWYSDDTISMDTIFRDRYASETNPPLYYILVRYFRAVFETNETTIRALSGIFISGFILLPLFIDTKILEKRTTYAISLLCAVSFGGFYFTHEARSYGLLLFISMFSSLFFIRILKSVFDKTVIKTVDLFALLLSCIANGLTHYFGMILSFSIFTLILLFVIYNKEVTNIVRIFVSGIPVGGIYLLWISIQFGQIDQMTGGEFWIRNDFDWYIGQITFFAKHFLGTLPAIIFFIASLSILIYRAHKYDVFKIRINSIYTAIISLILLSTAIPVIISLHTPIITHRYMLIILPSLYVLTGMAFFQKRMTGELLLPTSISAPMISVLLVLMGFAIPDVFQERNEDWRGAAQRVTGLPDCASSAIPVYSRHLYQPSVLFLYEYYLPESAKERLVPVNDLSAALRVGQGGQNDDGCSLLLWAMHVELRDQPELDRILLEEDLRSIKVTGGVLVFRNR